MACVFCDRLLAGGLTAETDLAAAFPDAFPLTPGHTLIVPRRHQADFFLLTADERRDVWQLLDDVKSSIERERRPDGYNLGVNIGVAAGQTVAHAHLHVIPRYPGDVDNPRGGIRWILPRKARYWESSRGVSDP